MAAGLGQGVSSEVSIGVILGSGEVGLEATNETGDSSGPCGSVEKILSAELSPSDSNPESWVIVGEQLDLIILCRGV